MDILAKNLLILASAGSGKTFQLANRVIGLVARGAAPERIVALTFTRKAAGEFADSVLTKLAAAANTDRVADDLRRDLALPNADFPNALERVVRALPRLTLGTMDGYFSKVIRSFQYEMGLTGGKFDLLEGQRAAALTDDLLAGILGDALDHDQNEEFFQAFRRATAGQEDPRVLTNLRAFVNHWQALYRESRHLHWGPTTMSNVTPDEWAKQKASLAATVLRGLDSIEFTRKGQLESLQKEIDNLTRHVIGSGSLGEKPSALLTSILDAAATPNGPLTVKSYKEFTIGGPTGDALRSMVMLAARCELSAALLRTRAVHDLIAIYDVRCATQLRQNGLLGFNDVKILMGEWAQSEDARLRREAVDFRLDARTDHWLLDEFQDTSRADWTGLLPLMDEAATAEDGTVFIVGDRKQAIYGWRGGDVGLFDEVITRYGSGLQIEPMAQSWRSCPEVLALVNQVCGDVTTLRELFGETANRWDWQDHVSASPLTEPAKRGEACVEVVGDWEDRLNRMAEILNDLGVGQRAMTCGVLLRGNSDAREVAEFLRARSFDVILEGCRQPAHDNPVGIAITHLLNWLADPADPYSREMIEMSPLAMILRTRHGGSWQGIWECLTDSASRIGFAGMIENIIEECWPTWSDFSRRRAGDLLASLATFDAQGGVSPREAADWIARLEVSQSPGVAAIQVMTLHKAKGLGFDVVILPEIPDSTVPQAQRFVVADGPDWLTQTPPKWARAVLPELHAAETRWASDQQYEALCMLYVALTRAKRGLYVLLQPPAAAAKPDKPSLANWLARSIDSGSEPGVAFQAGSRDWTKTLPMLEPQAPLENPPAPGGAHPHRTRMTPSAAKRQSPGAIHSPNGMAFGLEVHALLEHVKWVDDSPLTLPASDAGTLVTSLIHHPDLRRIFQRCGRDIELFREQPISAIVNGQLLTGIIDRLHVHRNPDSSVTQVEIIDYKTDAVKTPENLIERYSGQMNAYRNALQAIYPAADVRCSLLSVHHAALVAVNWK